MAENPDFEQRKAELHSAIEAQDHSEIIRLVDLILSDFEIENQEERALLIGNKADAQFASQEFTSAHDTYAQAFALDRSEERYIANMALAKLTLEEYLEAISGFDGAIFFNPKQSIFYHYRALAKNYLSDREGALRDLNKYLELQPEDPEVWYFRAQILASNDDAAASIESCDRALQFVNSNDELHSRIHSLRGSGNGMLGNYSEALQDFQSIADFDPDGVDYFIIGYSQLALNQPELAIENFDLSIESGLGIEDDEDRLDAFFCRGLAKGMLEDHPGAEMDFSASIAAGRQEPLVFFNRGVARSAQENYFEAIPDLLHAISLAETEGEDPNVTKKQVADIYFQLGTAYGVRNDHFKAVTNFDIAISSNPIHAISFKNRAIGRAHLGLLEGGLSDYQRAIELDESLGDGELKAVILERIRKTESDELITESPGKRNDRSADHKTNRREIKSNLHLFTTLLVAIPIAFPIFFFILWKLTYQLVLTPSYLASPHPLIMFGVTIVVASAFAPIGYLLTHLNISWLEERRAYGNVADTGLHGYGHTLAHYTRDAQRTPNFENLDPKYSPHQGSIPPSPPKGGIQ